MRQSGIFAAVLATGTLFGTATAHHSAAMFDAQKLVTLQGPVKAFLWTNPHSWIQLTVTSGGKITEWSIEMGSPQGMYRSGWRPGTLQAGQEIKVVVHPERDGSPVALFVSATHPDGRPLVQEQK